MKCLDPIIIKSPESRLLAKCRRDKKTFEYYMREANARRNLLLDPTPIILDPLDYYAPFDDSQQRLMQVPCGKCELCLKAKQDKYFIRCYYEYIHTTLTLRGSCWLVTLTYADEVLPHLEDGTPCFDKRHIQLFLMRLRKYSGLSFKYFIVCELGGEFGRPHYHGIFFVPNMLSNDNNKLYLLQQIANAWTKLEDRHWRYNSMSYLGLSDMQRVDVRPITDDKGISYVCKYIGKQFGADEFDALDIDSRFKRFHLQSIGLGECIYDYCNADFWDTGYVEVGQYKYAIPDYYRLKKMREYRCTYDDGSIVYQPSDFGLVYQSRMCRRQLQEFKDLCILNKDFPKVPIEFYDPRNLLLFYQFLDDYIIFRELPQGDAYISSLVYKWQDYLIQVQKYKDSQNSASAIKQKNDRKRHFLEKTNILRKKR